MLEYRPVLYRAADALDRGGGARELADSLYAELYGIKDRPGDRRSLFHYFQGRSSLATWLRAVLAQRYVDRLRAQRRFEPLPDEELDTGSDVRAGRRRGRPRRAAGSRSSALPWAGAAGARLRGRRGWPPAIGFGSRATTCRS